MPISSCRTSPYIQYLILADITVSGIKENKQTIHATDCDFIADKIMTGSKVLVQKCNRKSKKSWRYENDKKGKQGFNCDRKWISLAKAILLQRCSGEPVFIT